MGSEPADELVFAATLRINDEEGREALERLCQLLSEDMGVCVTPRPTSGPSELAREIGSGRAQFGWVSPTLLLVASSLSTAVPLLSSVRGGVAFFHTIVFTASSSAINTVHDLNGARAAWVDPSSASGYLVARLTIARQGVDVDAAFSKELFLHTHGEVARAVLEGRADIGATFAHFEAGDSTRPLLSTGYTDEHPSVEPRIIAVGGPIPSDMVVAQADVPLRTRFAFAAALCRLVHDPVGMEPLLQILGAEDFMAVSPQALTELEALTKASRTLG